MGVVKVPEQVVVVGASLAGVRAVQALREEGHTGRIVLVGEEPHLPYDRPPLSKRMLTENWPVEQIALLDRDEWDELDVDVRLGNGAVGLDVSAHEVRLADGEVVAYDGLVIATGAGARTLPGTPGRAQGVHSLRSRDDALRLRTALRGARSLGVIGGGFIGSEVAYGASGLGLEVTVLERGAGPMAEVLGPDVAESLAKLQTAYGIDLRTGVEVTRLVPRDTSGTRVEVHTADGSVLTFDEVLVSIGSVPRVEWLEGSSLRVDRGVLCEPTLFAGDDVVAAGDVVRVVDADSSVGRRVEHWTDASQQGELAAANLLAGRENAEPYTALPYVWSDQFGLRIEVLGDPAGADEVVEVPLAGGGTAAGGGSGDPRLYRYHRRDQTVAYVGIDVPKEILALRRAAPTRTDLTRVPQEVKSKSQR
ncbi:NAD(P)/FAD-dependent oxidoreductase [Streptomyces griseorubiginosus]|uniref:NAD(P)/FAD-dependent oxidoreductase n=1 Tax=Streptomyces griseorubiginosus TaxID=67304 RepID=UPI0036321C59